MYMLLVVVMSFVAAITLGGLIYAAIETDKFYWLAFVANLVVYFFFFFRHLAKAKTAAEKAEEAAKEKARKEGK